MTDHATAGIGCLKGCGIGCGCLILIAIGLAVVSSFTVVKPFNRAVESREELEQRFGGQENYTPAPDGAIAEDRVLAFLEVRAALDEYCAKIGNISNQMLAMESFDDEEEVSKVEVMQQALKTTQAAMTMAPTMGGFFEARNRSLLEVEMGLGEYTYIYVMAYHSHLVGDDFKDIFDEPAVNHRIHGALLQMLEAQRASIPDMPEAPQGVAELDAEIVRMKEEDFRIPWQDGLPSAISESVGQFHVLLEEHFCAPAVSLELLRNRKRSLAIESE